MNSVCKALGYCLLFAMTYQSQAQCVSGKKIETFSKDTIVFTCPDGKPDIISIRPFTFSTPFLFVVTNTYDTIVKVVTSGVIDFNELTGSEFHVYGYSYKGSLKKVVGLPVRSAKITDLCFERSLNYILVIKEYPLPPIINNVGLEPIYLCAPDSKPDAVNVDASFPSRNKVKYLVVSEENKIVGSSDRPDFDGDQLNCKVCKSYALSYTGEFTGTNGTQISSNLATECFALSLNFITFVRDLPRGGNIQFTDSDQAQFICAISKKNQILSTKLVNNSAGLTRTVFTDTLNRVLAINVAATIPVEVLGAGSCRIWGLTFTGKLTNASLGEDIKSITWSDDCYAITGNFLAVTKDLPSGGLIQFANLPDSLYICKDEVGDNILLQASQYKGQAVVWVITDQKNIIQAWSNSSIYDFNSLPSGQWRIYHLAYTGNLTLNTGQPLDAGPSDDCFDYSDQYLTVFVDTPKAGILSFTDQSSEKFYCATDTGQLTVTVDWSGTGFLKSNLFLTDTSDRFLLLLPGSVFDITTLKNGNYKIYAISYTGALNFVADSLIDRGQLSTGCSQISTVPLTLIKGEAKAGQITLENGGDTLRLCTVQTLVSVRFKSLIHHNSSFVYVLTSAKDSVIRVLNADTLHLGSAKKSICKIWGLAYTGQLLLKSGDELTSHVLASGCSDLSASPIIIIKDEPVGGKISLPSGDSTYTICHKDGWPDLIPFKTNSQSLLDYQFVLTDGSNKIIAFKAEEINFENVVAGAKKVYGVSYLGSVTAHIGDDINLVSFAADCYQWSENSIQIFSDELSGGIIKTNRNSTLFHYCTEDLTADTVIISSNGSTPGVHYQYIGIQSDTLKFISASGMVISTQLPVGTMQIFGIAYRGKFTAMIGDKVSAARLTDSCYNISSNVITIHRYSPAGGKVVTGGNIDEFFLCPQDGQADFITVVQNGEAPLPYAYIITTSFDSIIGWSENSSFDLDTFRLGFCKIFGISYTGTLQLNGKTIISSNLSTGCSSVSSDFIAVFKANADAGRVSLSNGDTLTTICVEDLGVDTLGFKHTGLLGLKYAFLVTDQNNRLQSIIEQPGPVFDFNGADPGMSRIYGVSYGGILTIFRNEDVTKSVLSTGCYDLSENFVNINKVNSGNSCKTSGVNGSNPAFLSIFPNPANQEVFLQLRGKYMQEGRPSLSLISPAGDFKQKINLPTGGLDNEKVRIDLSPLAPGIYFIIFKNGYIFDRVKLIVTK